MFYLELPKLIETTRSLTRSSHWKCSIKKGVLSRTPAPEFLFSFGLATLLKGHSGTGVFL